MRLFGWCVLLFTASPAFAGGPELPSWVHAPPVGGAGVYVVGIGDGASANEAQDEARRRGWQELVERVLGSEGRTEIQARDSLEGVEWERKTELATPLVKLDTLITDKKHLQLLEDGRTRCYVLLRLPPSEVARLTEARRSSLVTHPLGYLEVVSDPPAAAVLVDGAPVGYTPMNVALPPGRYQLRLEKQGYGLASRTVVMSSGARLLLNLPLSTEVGQYRLAVSPGGTRVFRGGELLGMGPELWVTLSRGRHELRFEAAGFQTRRVILEVEGGREQGLEVVLVPSTVAVGRALVPPLKAPLSQRVLEQADTLAKRKDWKGLVALAERYLAKHPSRWDALLYKGWGLLAQGRPLEGLAFLEASQRLKRNGVVSELLCEAQWNLGRLSQAKKSCLEAVQFEATSAGARALLAKVYGGLGDYAAAAQQAKAAAGLNSEYEPQWRELCQSHSGYALEGGCSRFR